MNDRFTRQLCFAVDVEGYSRGNDAQQSEVQRELSDLLEQAAQETGLHRESWSKDQRGDEELALIPVTEPENRVIDAFVRKLASLLFQRNLTRGAEDWLRLRVAFAHGPVGLSPMGYSGQAVVRVKRLLNSALARQALAHAPEAQLVLVLAHDVYSDLVVAGLTSLEPSRFARAVVTEKTFSEDAWFWLPGVETEKLRHALTSPVAEPRTPADRGLTAVLSAAHEIRETVSIRYERGVDVLHTLDVFRQIVELVDVHSPVTAYGSTAQVALAYVLAELAVIHNHQAQADPAAEFGSAAQLRRDMDLLVDSMSGVDAKDFEAIRRLIGQISLVEPEKLKQVAGMNATPTAQCFSLLWGLARLAQLLDNPGLVDAELPSDVVQRKNVLEVRHGRSDGCVRIDLAVTERIGYRITADAHHMVRRYFAELEDAWRRSHLIPPTISFELDTPNWRDRSLQVHEVRVDPRPITRLLMGRALYGDRPHVWLRELVQNSIDAVELGGRRDRDYVPRVEVEFEDPHHVTIRDNGIGMTYQQVLTQLSVLGRSGWRDTSVAEGADASAFFGRFGIGFASVFSVASSLEVYTRTADMLPSHGIAIRFSGADKPFYTEFAHCAVGTEIRITLTNAMTLKEFREAMTDLFAYLPPYVVVTPDVRVPSSLSTFSVLANDVEYCAGWSIVEGTERLRLGAYEIDCKIEILHDPRPHKGQGKYVKKPEHKILGFVSITYCVDGIRIAKRSYTNYDLDLEGCYVTVNFRREKAPVAASRNELDIDMDLRKELYKIIHCQVASLLPDLMRKVRMSCITDQDQRRAILSTFDNLFPRSRWSDSPRLVKGYYQSSEVLESAAVLVYRTQCPVLTVSSAGEETHALLGDVNPDRCRTVVLELLTKHAVFPAFVRTTGLNSWLVASSRRELSLIEQAWPNEDPVRVVDEAAQLYEDFQTVLPEIRDGQLWWLLRGDYGLSEGSVFGDALSLPLPGRRRGVSREVGLARRRHEVGATERPRMMLNRDHALLVALEKTLSDADDVECSTIQGWLDRLCKDVLEEKSARVANVVLRQLLDDLAAITGVTFSRWEVKDLRVS
ncbi:ATP-binding protein [Lentzea sp. NPDC054927]